MFNTVALILRPDEIRLFLVLLGALASTARAAVVRVLRRILPQALGHGRQGIPGRLVQVLSRPIAIALAISTAAASGLACAWILGGLGRLMCRWKLRRALRPPH